MNRLYFGDNLKWLSDRKEFPDASVDLVYLDPPFNSNADYNILFRAPSGQVSQAQFHAFTDRWSWADAAETYPRIHRQLPEGCRRCRPLQFQALARQRLSAHSNSDRRRTAQRNRANRRSAAAQSLRHGRAGAKRARAGGDVVRNSDDLPRTMPKERLGYGDTSRAAQPVCLITMPPRDFPKFFALPEYFRSDTPGLACSCDMYPNRLNL